MALGFSSDAKTKKRNLILIALGAILALGAGTMLAIMMSKSGKLENEFSIGNLGKISISEHVVEYDDEDNEYDVKTSTTDGNDYIVIPGKEIPKDPCVVYRPATENSAPVYVFLEVKLGSGWTHLTTAENGFALPLGGIQSALSMTIQPQWKYGWASNGGYVFWQLLPAGKGIGTDGNGNVLVGNKITVSSASGMEEALKGVTDHDIFDVSFVVSGIQAASFDDAQAAWNALNE